MDCYRQVIEIDVCINKIIEYFPSTIYLDSNFKDVIVIHRKTILKLMNKLIKSLRILLRLSIPNIVIRAIITNMSKLNVIQKIYIQMFERHTLSRQPRKKYIFFTSDDEFDAYYTITLVNDMYNNGINMLMKSII